MHIKNYEPFNAIPLAMLVGLGGALAIGTAFALALLGGLSWWWTLLPTALCFYLFNTALKREYKADCDAVNQYFETLSAAPLSELVVAVNDPNRPDFTRTLIRRFLNSRHPDWFTKLKLVEEANGIAKEAGVSQ